MEATGINEKDPKGIVRATQEQWRKPHLQSAQIVEEHAHLHDELRPRFEELQLIGVQPVPRTFYDWTAVLGATYTAMHKRIRHVVDECGVRQNVSFQNSAFLVSKRKRFADKQETDEAILKPVGGGLPFAPEWKAPATLPDDESEILDLILKQVGHRLLWDRTREYKVVAPNKPDGNAAGRMETYEAFRHAISPRGDALLIVSSQPVLLRDKLMAIKIFGDRFTHIDVTGYDMPLDLNVTKMLDELAKIIFETMQD